MTNIERIATLIKDEIQVDEQGRGFISLRGAARLADVSEQALSKAFRSDNQSPSKLAEFLISNGFEGDNQIKWGKSGIPDLALALILEYYGYEAQERYRREQAKAACRVFRAVGIRVWMQQIKEYQHGVSNTYTTKKTKLPDRDQALTPEIIAEIFRLVAKLDALERLSHTINHKRTAITGQLMKLLASHAGQVALNLLDDDDFKSLRRQLKIVGISLEEVCGAIAQTRLIPETAKAIEKAIDLGKPSKQTGSLYHYTKRYKGNLLPKVEGERDPNNPNHWYWGVSYIVWDGSKWCDRSMSISRKALFQVQQLLDNEVPVQEVLRVLSSGKV